MDYARVRQAFDRCLALAPAQREAELETIDLSSTERAEVLSLLAGCDSSAPQDEFANRISAAAVDSLATFERPQRLGPWRITGELGEGGMGVVLAAVRDDGEFDKQVAIKVIRGFPSASARERLRRERQILAGLEHPNIARLLDGGSTPGGEPYLVMEFVDGETLGSWLERQPSLDERMRLFAAICGAVSFAHQRLVVHRDLKPGNVLVRADGSPVLLDFGIAKLLDAGDTVQATRTQAMTPAYASPEQLRGEAVTTATDVFGLGLLLFVLLGGNVQQRSDPLRAATTTVAPASEAARQSTDPSARAFAPQLRGDLDAIVRLATRLDPTRRYASVALLALDVEAWLAGRPVAARAGDRWYLLGKFVQRHRASLAFGLVLLLGAAAFTARLALERDRARAAETRAVQEAATAQEVLAFVTGLFGELDPMKSGGTDLSARELLDRGRANLDRVRASSPQARAALQRSLGEIYRNSEQPLPAIELLGAARAGYAVQPDTDGDLIAIDTALAQAYNARLDGASAQHHAELAIARAEPQADRAPLPLAHAVMTHGVALQRQGRGAEAMADFERAQSLFERAGAEGLEGLASVLHNRGWVADSLPDYVAALGWYEQALARKQALLGPDHPSTLNSEMSRSSTLGRLQRLPEAEAALTALLPRVERVMGGKSQMLQLALNELGSVRQDLGHYEAALESYQRALATQVVQEGSNPGAQVAVTINNLASLHEDRGDLVAAEAGYRRSLAIRMATLDPTAPSVARAQHNLARVLMRQGKLDEAGPLLESSRSSRAARLADNHPERVQSQALRLQWLIAHGERDAADAAAGELAAALERMNPAPSSRTVFVVERALAQAAAARGDRAARVAAATRALAAVQSALPPDHPQVALARLDLADAMPPGARAEALRDAARPILQAALAPDAPDRLRLQGRTTGTRR